MKSERWIFPVRTPRFSFFVLLFSLVLILARTGLGGNFYAGTTPATVPWTNGIVPYEFTNTLSAAQKQTYLDGLREWELAANVKFVPHTNQTRWVLFAFNSNNFNNVSSGYNPQVVNIASLSRAQVGHEMGHSFGFQHENIRTDQTNYLTILSNNVALGNLPFLLVDSTTLTNGTYDFESVMHLARDFGSTQPGVLDTQLAKPAYTRYQPRMGNYTLSPGDRAALKYLYGPPTVPLTNLVTTTADAGPGSLRAAMYYVTDHPGSAVQFNIPTSDPGYSNGVFNIHLSGQLPTLALNGMIIDGSTQPGFTSKPLIIVDGSQIIPETFTSDTFLIYSANNQIKNISLQGFNWNGLTLLYADATNNTIAGCWIGLGASGSNAAPNAKQGIYLDQSASRNIIGGTNALARNALAGNREYGIWISGSNTAGNVVLGNYIGTDATGSFAVSNAVGGVILTGATHHNTVGGTNALARNVLSGNVSAGVWVTGTGVANNTIQGNFVGLNAAGTAALPNTFAGIYVLSGAQSNLVANNVISGNSSEGLRLSGNEVTANMVQGNYIGTDATGTTAIPNGFLGLSLYSGATNNLIGGTNSAARNVISGNGSEGLRIQGVGAAWNLIQGNFIGTTASGTSSLPNGWTGLTIFSGAASNVIGGTSAGARNILSGNWTYGLAIADPGTSGNLIQGNYLGLATNGSTALPNYVGVYIASSASSNTIGGTTSAARNVISGNSGSGIELSGSASGNFIQGNYIGPNATGSSATANGGEGINLHGSSAGNVIGGAAAGAGNVISGNTYSGIYAYDTNTSGNLIQGNFIGTKADGVSPLGNNYDGIAFYNGASSNVVGLALDGFGAGNTIAYNGFPGVYVSSDSSVGNTIRRNSIYSNGYLGINLVGGTEDSYGVTANDAGDGDTGPNNLQNYPVITNAFISGQNTIISGTLNSTANRSFWIDVYMNFDADPSGYGQAQVPVGSVAVTNNAGGNSVFTVNVNANYLGFFFSATATDKTSGDTSEFSADVMATNGPIAQAAPTFIAPITMTSTGFVAKISLTIGQNYRVQATTNLAGNPVPWVDLTNFPASATNYIFLDRSATNLPRRFYRAVSP